MAQAKVNKDRLGPLQIGDRADDIQTAGIPVSKLGESGATDQQFLKWDAAGTAWVPSSIPSVASYVDYEVPSGTIDGSNKIFSLGGTPSPSTSLQVFVSGVLMTPGTADDYTLSSNTITFAVAPEVNDSLLTFYRM